MNEGEFVGLVGRNGAGKTTTLSSVVGSCRPAAGTITFDGAPLAGASPDAILRRGVALVPEGRRIFARLSVAENLKIGAMARRDRGAVARDLRGMLERFPVLAANLGEVGRAALRRRAAAAGDRAGADVAPRACSCSTSRPWVSRR